jgi:CHAD domain-containing protein
MTTESTERLVLDASEPMAEAIRKVLGEQFDVMLANEGGSRLGDDIEHVHDMRVAVRRMRTAFRLFGGYYRRRSIKRFQKDLRDTGRALGAVRDLDVFNREAARYLRQQPKRRRHDLDPLLAHWRGQRETARLALIAYLDGEPYRAFVQGFGEFVRSPGAGVKPVSDVEPERFLVRDVLSSTVWQRYETVRAYGRVFDRAPMATLHAWRIDCKYLRYTLEYFQSLLGPDASWLIGEVIALQDHLGDMQDAEVAQGILGDFMAQHGGPQNDQGDVTLSHVAAYMTYRRDQQASLLATLPKAWARVDSARFRRRLASSLLAPDGPKGNSKL